MEEQNGTLNNDGASSTPQINTGDLISTVDVRPAPADPDPEKANNIQAPGGDNNSEAGGDPNQPSDGDPDGKAAGDEDDTRFDKHPRFQKLMRERNELRDRSLKLEARLEALEQFTQGKGDQSGKGGEGQDPGFKDITSLTPEQLLEWQAENPKEFLANLAQQIRHEVRQDVLNEVQETQTASAHEQKLVQTFSSFAEKHEDFKPMWDSGEIKSFMEENPGHNAISAYLMLTDEKRMAEAADKAKKEKENELLKNARVKQHARTMGAGASRGGDPGDPDAELKDTKSHGGLVAVLAARSQARQRAQT